MNKHTTQFIQCYPKICILKKKNIEWNFKQNFRLVGTCFCDMLSRKKSVVLILPLHRFTIHRVQHNTKHQFHIEFENVFHSMSRVKLRRKIHKKKTHDNNNSCDEKLP